MFATRVSLVWGGSLLWCFRPTDALVGPSQIPGLRCSAPCQLRILKPAARLLRWYVKQVCSSWKRACYHASPIAQCAGINSRGAALQLQLLLRAFISGPGPCHRHADFTCCCAAQRMGLACSGMEAVASYRHASSEGPCLRFTLSSASSCASYAALLGLTAPGRQEGLIASQAWAQGFDAAR